MFPLLYNKREKGFPDLPPEASPHPDPGVLKTRNTVQNRARRLGRQADPWKDGSGDGARGTFWGWWIYSSYWLWWWFLRSVLMLKPINSCTLNTQNLCTCKAVELKQGEEVEARPFSHLTKEISLFSSSLNNNGNNTPPQIYHLLARHRMNPVLFVWFFFAF